MLVLAETAGSFPDHSEPGVRYRLPLGLAPTTAPGGIPQVTLSRGPGSGLLQLRLSPVWPALTSGQQPVSFASGRFRLLMRTPSSSDHGEWRATPVGSEALVERAVSLDALELAMARRLGAGGSEVVEVEVELEIRGFAPVLDWLVQCDGELLRRTLAALLGAGPVAWERVEEAFLGLDRAGFDWHPLRPAALPPPIDAALRAIAHHAQPFILEAVEGGWRVRASAPAKLCLSLAVPYVTSTPFGMRWSFSEFLAAQPDPKRHLIDLAIPAPLEAASLLVVNDLPLAKGGVERVDVEVRTGGPSGRVNCVFLPGQPSAARLPFVRETFTELDLAWRARVTVATARGPTVVETAPVKTGLMVEVRARDIGLTPLHFRTTAEALAHAACVEIVVGARTLALTADQPEAWVVGRNPPATCSVTAVTASGQRTLLGDYPVQGGLTVDAATLGVGEPAIIVFRPPADAAGRAAYLALQVEGGPWRSLDPGATLDWPTRRRSRMEPLTLRYRTRHVPRLGTGGTGPIAESGWKDASGASVEVQL